MQEAKEAIENVNSLDKAHAFLQRNPNTMFRKALNQKKLYVPTEQECADSDGKKTSQVFEFNDRGYPASGKYMWNSYGQLTGSNDGDWAIDYTYNGDGFLIKKAARNLKTGNDNLPVNYVDSYSRDNNNQIQSRSDNVLWTSGKRSSGSYRYEYRPFYDEYCEVGEYGELGGKTDKTCYHASTEKMKGEWKNVSFGTGPSVENEYLTVNKRALEYDQYGYEISFKYIRAVGSRKRQSTGEYEWQEDVIFNDECSYQYEEREFRFF